MNFVVTAYDSLLQRNIIEDTDKGSVTTDHSPFLKKSNKTCLLSVELSVIIVDGDGHWLNVITGCHI